MPLSVFPVQLDSVGWNGAFTLVSLLAEPLPVRVSLGSLPSLSSAPLLKEPLCGPHAEALSPGLVLYALHLPKSIKSLSVRAVHSLPVPPTVLGDAVSLWNSPGWRCSCGRAASCVYV